MGPASFEVDDESDATGITFEAGVVKTLRLGQVRVLVHRGILNELWQCQVLSAKCQVE
jgi:hypothetical protein